MIILITGATHTGKTKLAQKLMEEKKIPYISQDHIKMGLIRSGYTNLTPAAPDEQMTEYIWPVTREMVKTAIENNQNLIVEGCYIPFDWENDFEESYRREIEFICICFSEKYVDNHFDQIKEFANCIGRRLEDSDCTPEMIKRENFRFIKGCEQYGLNYRLIEDYYFVL